MTLAFVIVAGLALGVIIGYYGAWVAYRMATG